VVDIQTIIVGLVPGQIAAGSASGVGGVSTGGGAVGSSLTPLAQFFPLGPTLDVIPYVSADGFTIQMTVLPSILEFLGYDQSTFNTFVQSVGSGGASTPISETTPLPHFRLRQVTTSAIVWDGQTLVLGGLITDHVSKVKDQLPVLGDLPFIGRLFRSESNISTKDNLVIFVTPTIIDPAGNRVHNDEDLPFAQTSVPVQKSIAQ